MDTSLVIAPRFNGPAHSGNGGYAAGLLAGQWLARQGGMRGPADGVRSAGERAWPASSAVEVTLRAPLPLGRSLQLQSSGPDGLSLMDGDVLLAQARATDLSLEVPPGEHRFRVSLTRREKTDDDAAAYAKAVVPEADTGRYAGRSQREATEHARRARAAIPATLVLDTAFSLTPQRVALVTLNAERRTLELHAESPRR